MSATPRVLVTSHLYPSPRRPLGAPWLAEQVDALARAGVRMEVLCPSPFERTGATGGDTSAVQVTYGSTSAGPLDGTRAGLFISAFRYQDQLRRFLTGRQCDFDLIHAHFAFPDAYAACRVGASLGIPVIATLHGSDVASVLKRPGILGDHIRRTLRSARALLCVSEELASAVRLALPAYPNVLAVPNGYDDTLFYLPGDDVPREGGLLFVGALRAVKNTRLLLEVYLATPELHSLPLTIVGDGPLRAELEALGAGTTNVRFTGALPRAEVAALMRSATALVLPSEREGYGVVAAEALACGTPVVGSSVGGLPEILAGEAAGVLVPPGDQGALTSALLEMLNWPHSHGDVAAASGARPWSARADELRNVYERVAAEDIG